MRRVGDGILLSAGDLITFLGCRHASALDRRALDEPLERTPKDPTLEFLAARGIEHEKAYRDELETQGLRVVVIPDTYGMTVRNRASLTMDAMRSGADVVYQAVLLEEPWHGIADFLMRTDTPSELGAWSYEPVDTKLATSLSPTYAVQLSVYATLLTGLQGVRPRHIKVVTGKKEIITLRADDFASFVRLAAERLEGFLVDDTALGTTVAEPCSACNRCHWSKRCKSEWEAADHLSLVANIRRSQIDKLRAAGIPAVEALASLEGRGVQGIAPPALAKLRRQAQLQVSVRGTGETLYELLEPGPGKGFDRLPHPSKGDLFFDMEGDPLYPGGLEYLFGVHWLDGDQDRFQAFWAHDRKEEKRAFQAFVDFVLAHLQRHPDAHIYHYNHYEVTAVRRLASFHATRSDVVDDLLRQGKFVDLFTIVREALLISEPRYSLKNVERFYYPEKRAGEVATAADSIVAYERWRQTGEQRILEEIESYNAIDCRSTGGLLKWLLDIRPAARVSCVTVAFGSDDALTEERAKKAAERQQQAAAAHKALESRLLQGGGPDEDYRQLVLELVDFHRREKKPQWWAMFDRQTRDEDELLDDAECLAGLTLKGTPVAEKQSLIYTYEFPQQETKLAVGKAPTFIDTLERAGEITAIDLGGRTVSIKRGKKSGPLPTALSLGPPEPIDDSKLRAAVWRFAESVAAGDAKFPALERFLRREAPRLSGRAPGQPILAPGTNLIDGAIAAVADLDASHLFIQGPPGTGKTYTTSRIVVAMIRRGRRVGVASNSHKAINNLLEGIEKAALEVGVRFVGQKKASRNDPGSAFNGTFVTSVYKNEEIVPEARLIAGTAWLFADPDLKGAVDYLFVDEAGQVALANLIAMGTAAHNIILVGDQMQLGQPVQGSHPGNSGQSALEYLLRGAATVPPDQGIFLNISYRMHPVVCGWISEAIYDGQLTAHPSTSGQEILLAAPHPALARHGLRFLPVEHAGRGQRSPEEADAVNTLWRDLMGRRWRDQHGNVHEIGADDVLVVAPYNVQVNLLRDTLPAGARVGTVDKFQGQEAAVVIISMTTSSGDDLPRDVDFLFSRNRLNVAISRARCLAVVVASPRLLEVSCSTVDQMRLVGTLCHAYEWSEGMDPRMDKWRAQAEAEAMA